MALKRELREPEAGGPALGPRPERLDIGGRQRERVEQLGRLRACEREVGRTDLREPAGDPQPLEADRRVAPRGHDQPEPGRHLLQKPLEVLGNVARPDLMEVVQDEHERLCQVVQRAP